MLNIPTSISIVFIAWSTARQLALLESTPLGLWEEIVKNLSHFKLNGLKATRKTL